MVKVNKIVKSTANPKLIKHTPITAEQIMLYLRDGNQNLIYEVRSRFQKNPYKYTIVNQKN